MSLRYRYTCPDRSLLHPDIPAQDLTDEDLDGLSAEQRATVEASPLYEAVPRERPSRTPVVEPASEPETPAEEGEP